MKIKMLKYIASEGLLLFFCWWTGNIFAARHTLKNCRRFVSMCENNGSGFVAVQ